MHEEVEFYILLCVASCLCCFIGFLGNQIEMLIEDSFLNLRCIISFKFLYANSCKFNLWFVLYWSYLLIARLDVEQSAFLKREHIKPQLLRDLSLVRKKIEVSFSKLSLALMGAWFYTKLLLKLLHGLFFSPLFWCVCGYWWEGGYQRTLIHDWVCKWPFSSWLAYQWLKRRSRKKMVYYHDVQIKYVQWWVLIDILHITKYYLNNVLILYGMF